MIFLFTFLLVSMDVWKCADVFEYLTVSKYSVKTKVFFLVKEGNENFNHALLIKKSLEFYSVPRGLRNP